MTAAKPGYQIRHVATELPEDVFTRAARLPTPNLADAMGKLFPACVKLKPMHRVGAAMVGRAFTVRVPPGDNLLVYKAIAEASHDDVIVVDAGGFLDQAIVGEIMTTLAASKGIAGVVIYGAIRDIDIIGSSDFPVYACGYTFRGPFRDGPGELNVPIAVAGVSVQPGDLVVGDANGMVVVPSENIESILSAAQLIQERESAMVEEIKRGKYDFGWIDNTLRECGYEI
jgi:RraA family protein